MPLSKQHKRETRERIVQTASRAFRGQGLGRATVPAVMAEAGLTHGGFYAHFPSKDALVAEAAAEGLVEAGEKFVAAAAAAPAGEEMRAIIDAYLSPRHRDDPATGCVIAALASELSREALPVRDHFTAALDTFFALLGPYVPEKDDQVRRDTLHVLFSGMAGALMLARAVSDPAESHRILSTARAFYTHALGEARNLDRPEIERSGTDGE